MSGTRSKFIEPFKGRQNLENCKGEIVKLSIKKFKYQNEVLDLLKVFSFLFPDPNWNISISRFRDNQNLQQMAHGLFSQVLTSLAWQET